ncbi:MAG: bifunctional phosphopantothenoylcysteine decarboxylase/phosphopantothenate--cysteine ligase CoaBC [Bryobacter sp.]|nr:bifunctional phosphopantothenoylcysteine decarboxylase/phosphopantothenate--cysteine ligase CoaBC [Bryobacter sp.]
MSRQRVILGVGGGIAAYKSAELVRLLVQAGFEVQPVLTEAAGHFITPLTLSTLSHRKVITGLFSSSPDPQAILASSVEHINVALENDLLLVAPATANLLGHFANGIASDFLTTLYTAFTGTVLLAPAMNTNMWRNSAIQRNVERLSLDGVRFVGPDAGDLACGMVGPGRMAEPAEILAAVQHLLSPRQDLAGRKVLLTAGPTLEPIDPVRVLTNRSSGKMGYALAQAAKERGAEVHLVSGPVSLEAPQGVALYRVETASQMAKQVESLFPQSDTFIGVAAVADYTPAIVAPEKLKKSAGHLTLELVPTQDILATVGAHKRSQIVVGFAAETQNLDAEAQRKLVAKNCDLLVANHVDATASVFGSDLNQVRIHSRTNEPISFGPAPKTQVAHRILDEVAALLRQR